MHYSSYFNYPAFLKPITDQGTMGVSFFFCLSGFIMTYNYFEWFKEDTKLTGKFLKARIARIYPMSIFVLLLATPLTLMQFDDQRLWMEQNTRFDITPLSTIISWLASLFLVQTFVVDSQMGYWVPPAWTLSVEMFFYAAFPLFVKYILSKIANFRALITLVLVLIFLQFFFFLLVLYFCLQLNDPIQTVYYVFHQVTTAPFLRVWEFFLGCAAGYLFLRYYEAVKVPGFVRLLRKPVFRNFLIIFSVSIIVVIINWNLNGNTNVVGGVLDLLRYFVLVTPFFCLILVACSFGSTLLHFVLDRPLFHLLGEASFSLYITQSVILAILPLVIKTDGSSRWLVGIGGIVLNILFSIFCYKYIETPARQLIRGNLTTSQNNVETVAAN